MASVLDYLFKADAQQAANKSADVQGQLAPVDTLISAINSATNAGKLTQSQTRFNNPQYEYNKTQQSLNPAARTAWQAQNAALVNDITTRSAQAAQAGLRSSSQTTGADGSQSSFANASANQQQNSTIPNNDSQTDADTASTDAIKNASSDYLIRQTLPGPIQNQRYYSAQVGSFYNFTSKFVPSISKYATFNGSLSKLMDNVGSTEGTNSPDYQNLLKFRQSVPMVANELRRQMGGQATDKEAALMDQIVDPDLYNKTPQQILGLWQNMGQLINTTGRTLKLSATQVQNNLGHDADPNIANNMANNGQNDFMSLLKKQKGVQ